MLAACKESRKDTHFGTDHPSSYYQEEYRPQFHFSPESMWMNDPNGMVYLDGEYHLFYQYYPDSTVWGPMHWGHAVSQDMIYWKHLPIALYPDSLGYIFSGSAVIDKENTAGFGKNAMVAIFTYHNMKAEKSGNSITYQTQAIAYSVDNGRTFKKYEGNPVISNPGIKDFRDPKVIWDDLSKNWILVLAAYDHVKFYKSKNLKDWQHLSDWGIKYGSHEGVWECPDLFPMKIEDSNETKWVLLVSINPGAPSGGSGTQYFVGDFDGETFTIDPFFALETVKGTALWLDYGADNYAGVTWSNIPSLDGRILFLGWMSNWDYAQTVPTEKWRSAMTLPRKLTLHAENGSYKLHINPVSEVNILNQDTVILEKKSYTDTSSLLTGLENLAYRLDLTVNKPLNEEIKFRISNDYGEFLTFGYNPTNKDFFVDRSNSGKKAIKDKFSKLHHASYTNVSSTIEFSIFLDHSSIELFIDNGRVVFTDVFFPTKPYSRIEIIAKSKEPIIMSGMMYNLKSIWQD